MSFKIFANALFVDTDFNPLRKTFSKTASVGVTSSFDIKAYSPKEYLFSHCTIIASVDTEKDCHHHITLPTEKYINQNYDSWTRDTLRGTYRTFIGAPNYVEHVQVPELSKGTIVDAVLRDIKGETLYCDILVATHRKHGELIDRIKTGSMKAMSMGCIAAYTFCTKCGKKAHNEAELCDHVRTQKGSKFMDKKGNLRTVAELCGQGTDPNSVKFIEASWVEVPAFSGAVLRNVLNVDKTLVVRTSSLIDSFLGLAKVAAGPKPLMGEDDTTEDDSEGVLNQDDADEQDLQDTLKGLFSSPEEDSGAEDDEDFDNDGEEIEDDENENIIAINTTPDINDSILRD